MLYWCKQFYVKISSGILWFGGLQSCFYFCNFSISYVNFRFSTSEISSEYRLRLANFRHVFKCLSRSANFLQNLGQIITFLRSKCLRYFTSAIAKFGEIRLHSFCTALYHPQRSGKNNVIRIVVISVCIL